MRGGSTNGVSPLNSTARMVPLSPWGISGRMMLFVPRTDNQQHQAVAPAFRLVLKIKSRDPKQRIAMELTRRLKAAITRRERKAAEEAEYDATHWQVSFVGDHHIQYWTAPTTEGLESALRTALRWYLDYEDGNNPP